MYRSVPLVVALSFLGGAGAGRASSEQFNWEIVAIDLTGRQTNLTRDPAVDAAPAVARDGRIVFVSPRGGAPDLFVMDADGSNVRRLTSNGTDGSGVVWSEALEISQASWAPRGERIAFDGQYWAARPDCARLCTNWQVLVVDSDGGQLRRIALDARSPAWSPDGRWLAYQSDTDPEGGAAGVTIARLDGAGSVEVKAGNCASEVGPVWSPTRDEIAYEAHQRNDCSRSWVYRLSADGRTKRRLAAGHSPAWSRDGRQLALIDDYRLFVIDRNGTRKRQVSRKREFVIRAAWSPKGATLAFVAGTTIGRYGGAPRNLRMQIVKADGRRIRVLRRLPWVWGGPVWAHNGKRILVTVVR